MNIKKMIPFLDNESLEELVNLILDKKETDIKLVYLAPFLSKELLDKIYERYVNKEIDINIIPLLPFLKEDTVYDLYKKVQNGEIELKQEVLYPFMGEEKIKEMFNEYVSSKSE